MSSETAQVSSKGPARTHKGGKTREEILQAAEQILREQGYAGLTTRDVANRAGVQLSQIHYHFKSRRGLLLGLFEELNNRLLHRQAEMFASNLPLWKQWELACDYLDEDLDSGYVRILNELAAAGWSDPEIGDAVRLAIADWKQLLLGFARRGAKHLDDLGPLSPEDIAALVASVFLGAEMFILSGHETTSLSVRRALRRVGEVFRQFEKTAKGEG